MRHIMKETRDIILRLIKIRQAERLTNNKGMSADDIQKLRDFILENRRRVPPFALSHFDRLEASGGRGIAAIENGKCSFCGTPVPKDELDYLEKAKNIGVCDHCYAFLYIPDDDCKIGDFFENLLKSE